MQQMINTKHVRIPIRMVTFGQNLLIPQCCVANASRILPFYISHMWMKTQDNGLAATFYGPCEVNTMVNNKKVNISCKTDYPFRENIDVHVNPHKSMTFSLYFRIPDWCENLQVTINGKPVEVNKDRNGFLKVLRKWSKDDLVNLVFPMQPRLHHDVEKDFPEEQIDYYAEDRWGMEIPSDVRGKITSGLNLPFESIYYGPLLFSLPIPDDGGPAKIKGNPEWRYALNNDAALGGQDINVTSSPMPEKWDWPLDAPIKLKVPAKKFDWKPERYVPLPYKPITGGEDETIILVPFGSTLNFWLL